MTLDLTLGGIGLLFNLGMLTLIILMLIDDLRKKNRFIRLRWSDWLLTGLLLVGAVCATLNSAIVMIVSFLLGGT